MHTSTSWTLIVLDSNFRGDGGVELQPAQPQQVENVGLNASMIRRILHAPANRDDVSFWTASHECQRPVLAVGASGLGMRIHNY